MSAREKRSGMQRTDGAERLNPRTKGTRSDAAISHPCQRVKVTRKRFPARMEAIRSCATRIAGTATARCAKRGERKAIERKETRPSLAAHAAPAGRPLPFPLPSFTGQPA